METAFPTVQRMGRSLSTNLIDPLVDAFNTFVDTSFELHVPRANIAETEQDIRIDLAAPGLQKDDFTVHAEGHQLTVSAEKETSTATDNETTSFRREYNYTSFTRSFLLPEAARPDQAKATYEDGVLHILIPKADVPKRNSKTIAID